MSNPYVSISECRSCGSKRLSEVFAFGSQPVADGLVRADAPVPDERYPLTLVRCSNCHLVQILETVDPKILFSDDYPYFSSVSPSLLAHFQESVESLIASRDLGSNSQIVELASNDGYLLKNYVEVGIPVLGIDPALGPVTVAREAGVDTLHAFFGRTLAEELVADGLSADVLHANNVLAHVADLGGFVDGIRLLLKENGVAVIECPYLPDLLASCEFDTIYHQHLCYFSVIALDNLFAQHDLHLNDVQRTAIHGGSIRVFVSKQTGRTSRVEDLIACEKDLGLDTDAPYERFAEQIHCVSTNLRSLVDRLKAEGKRLAGHGAAAKATTMMGVAKITNADLDYILDRNQHKHGWCMPGSRIPIVSPEHIKKCPPDYLLVLAWNFAEEIISEHAEYEASGGKFIVPIPKPRII